MDQSDLRIVHLDVSGFIPELPNDGPDLGSAGGSDGVTFGQQSAVHIHRDAAFLIGFLAFNQFFALPRGCEAKIFIGHHFRDGETVMDFGDIDIAGGDTCHLIGLFAGLPGHGEPRKQISAGQIHSGCGGPQAHDPNRLFTKCFGLFLAGDNDAGAAVGVGTAVAYPKRTGHRSGHAIFRIRKHVECDRLAVDGLVI